jgi:hypothetical protein
VRIGEPAESPASTIHGAELLSARTHPRAHLSWPATTVRIELLVDDPRAVHDQAVAAGAASNPVEERTHEPLARAQACGCSGHRHGSAGHVWLIGRFLE